MGEETTDVQKVETQDVAMEEQVELSPPALLSRAVQSGADVQVLERLMELQERWETNQARKAFDQAMAAIRSDLPRIEKKGEVDFGSGKGRTYYKYERLQDVVEAIQPVLSKHGLSFRWRTDSSGGEVSITCIISHELGHSEETTLNAPLDQTGNKNAIQSIGSTVTYLQRYTLKAALGVAAADDDDGQAAGPRRSEQKPDKRPNGGSQSNTATDKQLKFLHSLGAELYGSTELWDQKRPQLVAWATKERTKHSGELTKAECSTLIEKLQEHKEAQEQADEPDDGYDIDDDEIPD